MARWLKSLFFVFVLCGSVLSGTVFADSGMSKEDCLTKCCKRKAENVKSGQIDAASLCRAMNCTNPAPISTANSTQMNLVPLLVILKTFPIFRILLASPPKDNSQPKFAETVQLKTFQPKYIQNQSFLI